MSGKNNFDPLALILDIWGKTRINIRLKLGQYAVIREAVSTNIHDKREKSEWNTQGGEATEGFSRGFFSSLEWIFEILLNEAQHIVIIPRFLIATIH